MNHYSGTPAAAFLAGGMHRPQDLPVAAAAASPSLLPGQAAAAALPPGRRLRHHSGAVLDVIRYTSTGDPVVELPHSGTRHAVPLADIGSSGHQSYQWLEPETAEPPAPSLLESEQGAAVAETAAVPDAEHGTAAPSVEVPASELEADRHPRPHELRPTNVCSGDTYLLHHEGRWVRHVAEGTAASVAIMSVAVRAMCGVVRPWHEAHVEASPGWTVTTCSACRDACLPPPELPFPPLPEMPAGHFVAEAVTAHPLDLQFERVKRLTGEDFDGTVDVVQPPPKRKRRTKLQMAEARAASAAAVRAPTIGDDLAAVGRGIGADRLSAMMDEDAAESAEQYDEKPAVTGDSLGDSPSGEPSSGAGTGEERQPPVAETPREATVEGGDRRRPPTVAVLEDSSHAVSIGDGPRLEYDVPASEYHRKTKGEASVSGLKEISRSPLHYEDWIVAPERTTPAFTFGRAFHAAVLERHVFERDYVVRPAFGDLRTTVAKQARDAWAAAAGDRTPIDTDDAATIEAMRASLMRHPIAGRLLGAQGGRAEVVARWKDPSTGLECKARGDWYVPSLGILVDLKSCETASPSGFGKAAANFDYPLQSSFYSEGWAACGAPLKAFVFVCAEKSRPYAVAVYQLDAEAALRGGRRRSELMDALAGCVHTGRYPGYGDGLLQLTLPAWSMR